MSSYQKENPETIQQMFNSIAEQYDRANGILSFQLHKRWNRKLINQLCCFIQQQEKPRLLDLCSGTGDIVYEYVRNCPRKSSEICLVDFSSNMLCCAQEKMKHLPESKNHEITFIEGDVQCLPLLKNSYDYVTIAYGIRNVKNLDRCFKEVYRVLKPGGGFGILELTRPNNLFMRMGHDFYLKYLLPSLGKLVTRNQDAYDYLQNSIRTFISPFEIKKLLLENGFHSLNQISLTGGIATIFTGIKS